MVGNTTSHSSNFEGSFSDSLDNNNAPVADPDLTNNYAFKDTLNSGHSSDCKNGRVELFFNITNVFQAKQQSEDIPSAKHCVDYSDAYDSILHDSTNNTLNISNSITFDPYTLQDESSSYKENGSNKIVHHENITKKRDKKLNSPVYLIFV